MPSVCLLPTKDSLIDGKSTTTNYGTVTHVDFAAVYIAGPTKTEQRRALIMWNIPLEIPTTGIYKAFVYLYEAPYAAAACSLYRVTATWTEADVTWVKRTAVTDWGTAGGDYAEWTTPIDFTSRSTAGWQEIDVTAAVIESITTYGRIFDILIKLDAEDPLVNTGALVESRDSTVLDWARPQLVIVRPPFGRPFYV